jgi:hypothetical protein
MFEVLPLSCTVSAATRVLDYAGELLSATIRESFTGTHLKYVVAPGMSSICFGISGPKAVNGTT